MGRPPGTIQNGALSRTRIPPHFSVSHHYPENTRFWTSWLGCGTTLSIFELRFGIGMTQCRDAELVFQCVCQCVPLGKETPTLTLTSFKPCDHDRVQCR